MADTQYGLPLIIDNFSDKAARGLKRVRLEKSVDAVYNERWLQKLVSRYPNLLPIEQIEPALTPVIPICMELPLASGFADNLYATPDGDLIIGEPKLFRNPEARREVVGQLMDYAKDLSALSYEDRSGDPAGRSPSRERRASDCRTVPSGHGRRRFGGNRRRAFHRCRVTQSGARAVLTFGYWGWHTTGDGEYRSISPTARWNALHVGSRRDGHIRVAHRTRRLSGAAPSPCEDKEY